MKCDMVLPVYGNICKHWSMYIVHECSFEWIRYGEPICKFSCGKNPYEVLILASRGGEYSGPQVKKTTFWISSNIIKYYK